MNKQSVSFWPQMAISFFLKKTMLPALALLFSLGLSAQSFFKNYPTVEPSFTYYLDESPGGFEFGPASLFSFFTEIRQRASTDQSGNLLLVEDLDFAGGRPVLRLANGNYLRASVDAGAHQAVYELLNATGGLLNTVTFDFPSGDMARMGNADEFADGDVFVSYHHGEPQIGGDPPAEKRTVVYAKVNLATGAVAWQNEFQSENFVYSAQLRLVKVAPDGSVFAARNEEFPNSQQHYVMKISASGQILWDNMVSTLERSPSHFAPTPDGGVWYIFNQVFETVSKFNADGTSAGGVLLDPVFMAGATPTAIAPMLDGGVMVAGTAQPFGASEKAMYTAVIGPDVMVAQTNLLDNLPFLPQPRQGIRTSSGEFVFTGSFGDNTTTALHTEAFLVKVDENGEFVQPPSTCTNNLLVNPGFEDGFQNWDLLSQASISSDAFAGSNAARVESGGNRILQFLPAQPGEEYTLTVQAKTDPAGSHGTIGIKFLSSTWQPLDEQLTSLLLPGGYQTVGPHTRTAPPNTAYIEISLYNFHSDVDVLFDEVCLTTGGGGNLPDLISENFTATSTTVEAGTNFGFTLDAVNQGGALLPGQVPFEVQVFFSNDNTLSPDDIAIGQPLTVGLGMAGSGELVPGNTPAGQYFALLKIDSGEEIPESNEANNVAAAPQMITVTNGNQVVCPGDITLSSQAQVDNWPGCTIVEGNLRIAGNDITDLGPLATLQKVRGALSIDDNAVLASLSGLQNVDSVGALIIAENAQLATLAALNLNQTDINSIVIYNNDNLTGIGGFNNFLATDNLEILNNDALTSLTGFNGLATVDGNLLIEFNTGLPTIGGFAALSTIAGGLQFVNNDALTGIGGMGALTTVQGNFIVSTNASLLDLNGLSSLSDLHLIAIAGNPVLANLDVFSSVTSISNDLNVINNASLSDCCGLFNLLNGGGVGGSVVINGNPMFCGSETEILTHCVPSGDIDLELDLAQPNATPAQWSSYTITATVSNTGGQTATGVQVSFAKPAGVVYTGGNEWTASQGSFNPFGNEIWTVGSIPAGGSATLTVSYFLLASESPTAYAQVTAANETDGDSTPGNGTPPTVNEDDEASTGGGGPPNLNPDLVAANLDLSSPSVEAGQLFTYDFDLSNIGDGPAPGNFVVRAYISTDAQISPDDIQDGFVSTGNYGAGLTVTDIPGSSAIPANLPDGTYYLILKVDADGQVAESNENNNEISAVFTVADGGGPVGCDDECGFDKTYGAYPDVLPNATSSSAAETAGGYQFFLRDQTGVPGGFRLVTLETDFAGNQTGFSDEDIVPPATDVVTATSPGSGANEITATKTSPGGTVVWSTTFSLDITETVAGISLSLVYDVSNGHIVTGTYVYLDGSSPRFVPFTVKLDSGGNVAQQNFFDEEDNVVSWGSLQPSITGNGTGYSLYFNGQGTLFLVKIGLNGERFWKSNLASDLPSNQVGTVREYADGSAVLVSNRNNGDAQLIKYDAQSGDILWFKNLDLTFSVASSFSFFEDAIPTSDGGAVAGFRFNSFATDGFVYGRLDANGNPVWSFLLDDSYRMNAVIETSDCGYLFFGQKGDDLGVLKVTSTGAITPTCDGGPTGGDCDDVSISTGAGSITISGAAAPHVIMKVFTPTWQIVFDCLDGTCSDPQVVSGLGSGPHFVEVLLLDAGWGEICKVEQTVNVSSLTGGPVSAFGKMDVTGRPVQLVAVAPNPVYHGEVKVVIDSREEGTYELEAFDLFGRRAFLQKIELQGGRNDIRLDVSLLESGTYYLNLPGQNWRNMPLRFVVARW